MALTSILDEALEAWEYTRGGVIAELQNLSESEMAFKPNADSRTPAELAFHIIQSGLVMSGELTRPDANFRRKSYPQFIREHAGHLSAPAKKADLVRLLKRTHAEGAKKIREAGDLMMMQFVTRFDGERGTRLAWMHHGISHEEYHRGQLALYARLVGRTPALTQLILGMS